MVTMSKMISVAFLQESDVFAIVAWETEEMFMCVYHFNVLCSVELELANFSPAKPESL
jgi:hypothetical protein